MINLAGAILQPVFVTCRGVGVPAGGSSPALCEISPLMSYGGEVRTWWQQILTLRSFQKNKVRATYLFSWPSQSFSLSVLIPNLMRTEQFTRGSLDGAQLLNNHTQVPSSGMQDNGAQQGYITKEHVPRVFWVYCENFSFVWVQWLLIQTLMSVGSLDFQELWLWSGYMIDRIGCL